MVSTNKLFRNGGSDVEIAEPEFAAEIFRIETEIEIEIERQRDREAKRQRVLVCACDRSRQKKIF